MLRLSQVQVSLDRHLMKIHQVFFSTHSVWNNATKRGCAKIDNLKSGNKFFTSKEVKVS